MTEATETQANDPQALIDQLTRQVSDLNGRLATAEGDRDGFRGKLRTTVHKQAFRDKVTAAKADPKAVDALWKLHGYEPTTDEVDPKALDDLVKLAKDESPFAFLKDEVLTNTTTTASPRKLETTGDPSRGRQVQTPGKFEVRRSELADGAWMQANQDKVSKAHQDGTFALIEG